MATRTVKEPGTPGDTQPIRGWSVKNRVTAGFGAILLAGGLSACGPKESKAESTGSETTAAQEVVAPDVAPVTVGSEPSTTEAPVAATGAYANIVRDGTESLAEYHESFGIPAGMGETPADVVGQLEKNYNDMLSAGVWAGPEQDSLNAARHANPDAYYRSFSTQECAEKITADNLPLLDQMFADTITGDQTKRATMQKTLIGYNTPLPSGSASPSGTVSRACENMGGYDSGAPLYVANATISNVEFLDGLNPNEPIPDGVSSIRFSATFTSTDNGLETLGGGDPENGFGNSNVKNFFVVTLIVEDGKYKIHIIEEPSGD